MRSDWESNCPRAVLQCCITTSLSQGGSEGKREGKTPPREASPFCMKTRARGEVKYEYSHSCVGLCGSVSTVYSTVGQECHFSEEHLFKPPTCTIVK